MTALVLGGALVALGGLWWWLEGSLRRDCRRLLTARDLAALGDLERSRAATRAELAEW